MVMSGLVVWLLIGLFFKDGQFQAAINVYTSEQACQTDANKATAELVSKNINTGSVTCVKTSISTFS